jgi:acyl-CoA thioesterase-1
MAEFLARNLSRRRAVAGLLLSSLFPATGAAAARRRVVTMLGDSITAGYGLPYAQSLPAQLQAELLRRGADVRVRAAGVSGDTSAAGLARSDFSVQSDTDLCIVALGGNDLLQAIAPTVVRRNLSAIVDKLKRRRIRVLLAGVSAPARIDHAYAAAFDAVFPAVARAEHVPVYPNLLAGVEQVAGLNQGDGIHANARGVKLIAARLAPVALEALGRPG